MSARRYFVVLSFDAKEEESGVKMFNIAKVHAIEKLVRDALGAPTRSPVAWNVHDILGWPESGRHQATFLYTGDKKTLYDLRDKFLALFDYDWCPSAFIAPCSLTSQGKGKKKKEALT